MSNSSEYVLQVGDNAAERLLLLDEVYGPYTHEFLKKIGLKSNYHILEVGCGTGNTTCWLAEQLGPQGKVTAVDVSAEQIKIAKQQAEQKNLKNIDFRVLSVFDLDQLSAQFDLVFSRFFLVHLSDPAKGLHKMYDRVKPKGGILACDELSLSSAQCYPNSKIFTHSKELTFKLARKKALDYDFGLRLFHEFKKLNLKNIQLQTYQPVLFTETHKNLWLMFFQEAKAAFLSTEVISEIKFEKLLNELEHLVNDEHYYFLSVQNFQAWSIK